MNTKYKLLNYYVLNTLVIKFGGDIKAMISGDNYCTK